MIGISRRRRSGPDRFLYARLVIFFLGAGLFFGGVATRRDWAVLVAIGILLVGLMLRFVPAGKDGGEGAEDTGEGE